MNITTIPWIVAVVAALAFGWLAHRAERGWLSWALGGGLLGLLATTIIWGVGQAAAIPFSDHARTMQHIHWTLEAVGVVVVCGIILAWCLPRRPAPPQSPAGKP